MILAEIVKKGQLQMGVESRKPRGFFRLKHFYIISEQKKLHIMVSAWGYPSINSQVTMAIKSQSMLVPEG